MLLYFLEQLTLPSPGGIVHRELPNASSVFPLVASIELCLSSFIDWLGVAAFCFTQSAVEHQLYLGLLGIPKFQAFALSAASSQLRLQAGLLLYL